MKYLIIFLMCFMSLNASRYELTADSRLVDKSLGILVKYVGVKEVTGRNDGKQVEAFLKSVLRFKGDAWCCAFQYFGFKQASLIIPAPIPIPRTGRSQNVYTYAMKYGKKTTFTPQKHDLIVWRRGNTSSGHIERIVKVDKGGWVTTIAGNVSNQVLYKKRNILHPLGNMYVRGLVGFKK